MRKIEFTDEMIEDLSKIRDSDFAKKWGMCKSTIVRKRRTLGISSFIEKGGAIEYRTIDGVLCKYCPKDGGHWESIENFYRAKGRRDGIKGVCKYHEDIYNRLYDSANSRLEEKRAWRKTESGRESMRRTWRRRAAIDKSAFVKWDRKSEELAYMIFGKKCAYCGEEVSFLDIEFDHVVPIAKGGKTEPKNMVPSCSRCNRGKKGKQSKDLLCWLIDRFGGDLGMRIYKDVMWKLNLIDRTNE